MIAFSPLNCSRTSHTLCRNQAGFASILTGGEPSF